MIQRSFFAAILALSALSMPLTAGAQGVTRSNEIDRMRQTLQEGFNFDSPDEWILRNEEATSSAIRRLIDDLGRNLQPDDALAPFE